MTRRTTRKTFDSNPSMVMSWGDRLVLIWSGEHNAYWKAGASGYTTNKLEAGVYTFADAMKHTDGLGKEKRIIFERHLNDGEDAEDIYATMANRWGVSRIEAKRRALKAMYGG